MRKLSITIIILIILGLFGAADFYLNSLDTEIPLDTFQEKQVPVVSADDTKPKIDSVFTLNEEIGGYKIVNQTQASQVFEKIDLSNIRNIKVYKNILEKPQSAQVIPETEGEGVPKSSPAEPIFLYEVQGPENQGNFTYLNVKLQFIAQLTSEDLNETSEYGYNSFYFNDPAYANTSFMLAQIGDNLFGFQYKKAPSDAHENVKEIIKLLMDKQQPTI